MITVLSSRSLGAGKLVYRTRERQITKSCTEIEASVVAVLSSRSLGAGKLVYRTCERQITKSCTQITITVYFINPSGKLKLSFDRTAKNISQIMNHTHMHTPIHTPPFSQSDKPRRWQYRVQEGRLGPESGCLQARLTAVQVPVISRVFVFLQAENFRTKLQWL